MEKYIYAAVFFFIIFGTASFIEFYKKTIRKDKSKSIENKTIGLILSGLWSFILYKIDIIIPLLARLGAPGWTDIIFYTAIFYFIQFYLDMKIIKSLFKNYCKNLLLKTGLSEEQAESLLNSKN